MTMRRSQVHFASRDVDVQRKEWILIALSRFVSCHNIPTWWRKRLRKTLCQTLARDHDIMRRQWCLEWRSEFWYLITMMLFAVVLAINTPRLSILKESSPVLCEFRSLWMPSYHILQASASYGSQYSSVGLSRHSFLSSNYRRTTSTIILKP